MSGNKNLTISNLQFFYLKSKNIQNTINCLINQELIITVLILNLN